MGEYITQKSELYARTRQSMARVLQSKSASSGTSQTAGSASSWGREQWNGWNSRGRWWTTESDHWPSDTSHVPEDEETEVQDEAEHDHRSEHSSRKGWEAWPYYGGGWHGPWSYDGSAWTQRWSEEADWVSEAPGLCAGLVLALRLEPRSQ